MPCQPHNQLRWRPITLLYVHMSPHWEKASFHLRILFQICTFYFKNYVIILFNLWTETLSPIRSSIKNHFFYSGQKKLFFLIIVKVKKIPVALKAFYRECQYTKTDKFDLIWSLKFAQILFSWNILFITLEITKRQRLETIQTQLCGNILFFTNFLVERIFKGFLWSLNMLKMDV